MSDQPKTPWKNGNYISDMNNTTLIKVDGEKAVIYNIAVLDVPDMDPMDPNGSWKYGDFGPAHEDVQKLTGIKNNNFQMNAWHGFLKYSGVVCEDGETIYMFGMLNCVETMKWQSEEDIALFSENRDPIDEPSCPYKIQPENQGKLVWLSGPPGAGKSTTCQLMAKEAGYVYYEADCTTNNLNPFIGTDVENPTIAAIRQKPLKGATEEYYKCIKAAHSEFEKMSGGKIDQIDWEKFKPFFSLISKNIGIQKARVGGNFAIAQAVQSRDQREHIKKTLPDVVFIVMSLTKENQKKRLKDRHGDQAEMMGEMLEKMFDLYEKPGDGEENAYNVDITEDMTTKDVLDKVLEVIDKNCK